MMLYEAGCHLGAFFSTWLGTNETVRERLTAAETMVGLTDYGCGDDALADVGAKLSQVAEVPECGEG